MLNIQTFETHDELEKWANYFRFHYLHERMTFEKFLHEMANGVVAKRTHLNWEFVQGPHQQKEERICTTV